MSLVHRPLRTAWRRGLVAATLLLSATALANPALAPVDRNGDDWWKKRQEEKNARIAEGNVDLIFIGDSITHSWETAGAATWAKYYGHRNAVDLGFSGDRTEHVLWRLDHGNIDGISPKAAVIMIGTNNIGHKASTPEQTVDGVKAILAKLQVRLPETKILLLSVFPREKTPDADLRKATEAINAGIAALASDRVTYLDLSREFLDKDGTLPEAIMPDALHPNERGYEIWAAAMEPALARLLGEAPVGYAPMFNGKDLSGWRGLVDDPEKRAAMTPEELAAKYVEADAHAAAHWHVEADGTLYFDGGGSHLCTPRWYEDFEMLVDWKIEPKGDSGIYLRGTPQVQIWDPAQWPQGSGGLYNNKLGPADPLVLADNPIGEWNTFHIKMVGPDVTVYLNDKLVVDKQPLENYWNREKPIYPSEQIELQAHGTKVWWKNIYIREIPRGDGWVDLCNGKDLTGWEQVGGEKANWGVENGVLFTEGEGGWLSTKEQYSDFELELEFNVPAGGNSGVFIRCPREGNPAFEGSEIQVLDDYADQYKALEPYQYCGSMYSTAAPSKRVSLPAGTWQKMRIRCEGPRVQVNLNGQDIIDANQDAHPDKVKDHPGLKRYEGYIGLQNHGSRLDYRNIRIRPLK
jgi:lysophospholipase L1-like esterase